MSEHLSSRLPNPSGRRLPGDYYRAAKMRAAGYQVQQIAACFGKNRGTIWRWLQAVKNETRQQRRGFDPFDYWLQLDHSLKTLEADMQMALLKAKDERTRLQFRQQQQQLFQMRQELLQQARLLRGADYGAAEEVTAVLQRLCAEFQR